MRAAMVLVWVEFLVCVALIWLAGTRLSRYGDVIAEKAGLSRTWIGLILLATVTSLPELITGISAWDAPLLEVRLRHGREAPGVGTTFV